MKAPYAIKYNDTYYHPGDELPEEVAELLKPGQEKLQRIKDSIEAKEKENAVVKLTATKQ